MPEYPYSLDSPLAIGRIPHDTEADRDALESVIKRWTMDLEQVKWPRALQYFENASYLVGNHFTRFFYDPGAGFGFHTFGVHDRSDHDALIAKSADNVLIRPVETIIGLLTQSQPFPRVEPNSDLPEDEDAAALAEIALQVVYEKPLMLGKRLRQAVLTALICGTVAFEVEYGETDVPVVVPKTRVKRSKNPLFDPAAGEEGELTEPEYLEEAVPAGEEVEFKRGIMGRLWTPFHLTVDPAATDPSEIQWVARQSFEDLDWIRDAFDVEEEGYYPENLDGITQQNAAKHVLFWWSKIQDLIDSPQYVNHGSGLTPQTFHTSGGYAPNQVVFTVIDVKPNRNFPRGRTLILAGGELLYCGDARAWSEQYPERWHPYAFWSWFDIVGRFWGIPLLSELIPLQKKINAIDALVHQNRQHMSIGQWLIPKHARIPDGYNSGIPGQDVRYTAMPGLPNPEKVRNAPLPGELLAERDQLLRSIDAIASSGMVGDQISKSAARAGVILDFLRQEKLRSKAPTIQDFEHFLETISQNILIEIQLNLIDEDEELTERIRKAAREHPIAAIDAFTGSSLRDHHSVTIDISSDLMHSPEAREAKAMEFFQASGGDVSAPERAGVMKAIGLDKFVDNPVDASVRRAERMIAAIRMGRMDTAIPMEGIDDYTTFAAVFKNAVLDPRFEDYEPPVQQKILELLDWYIAANEKQQIEAFQKQLQMTAALAKAEESGKARLKTTPQK